VGGEVDAARLREVAEAATLHPKNSLPWMVDDDDENDKPLIVLAPKDVGGWDGIVVARCPKPEDALHIATFDPPTVLALLARLEAAESALGEWQETAQKFCDDYHAELEKRIDAEAALGDADRVADERDQAELEAMRAKASEAEWVAAYNAELTRRKSAESARDEALAVVERVRAVAEGWKAIPKPQSGWNSGLSATEAGNRLGAWNVRRMHADEILAALTPSAPTEEER
jgi:hypothetical protein